jgi:hypothetical protein
MLVLEVVILCLVIHVVLLVAIMAWVWTCEMHVATVSPGRWRAVL